MIAHRNWLAAALVLAASALAHAAPPLPDNTLVCAAFTKNSDGSWSTVKQTEFKFAGFDVKLWPNTRITDTSYFYDNNRLIDTLNGKCGAAK